MKREVSRKEIFEREIKSGATIQEIKIYTNSLNLIIAVMYGHDSRFDYPFLTEKEYEDLKAEVKDLKQKIRIYEKKMKAIESKKIKAIEKRNKINE